MGGGRSLCNRRNKVRRGGKKVSDLRSVFIHLDIINCWLFLCFNASETRPGGWGRELLRCGGMGVRGAGKLCKYRQLKVFRLIAAAAEPGKKTSALPVIEHNENNRSIEF